MKHFYLSNLKIDSPSAKKIKNEGFNTQKNGGFNLEHAYSTNVFAVKNFYLLLQIAHILIQVLEYGLLGKKRIKKLYGSGKNVARRLLEELKFTLVDDLTLKWLNKRIRIYFDTSWRNKHAPDYPPPSK